MPFAEVTWAEVKTVLFVWFLFVLVVRYITERTKGCNNDPS